MKLSGAIGTAVLSLTLGIGIPAYAQQDQHEQEENKDKTAQEKEKKAQPEKSAKPEEKNARPEDKNTKPEEKSAQEQKNNEEKNAQEKHAQDSKPVNQVAHAGRIPDDRFKANFGQEHHFRVSQAEYGNRRFQYGGYWFGFESAWPSNWLYTQDVYVIEIDGVYYLCNANYPGVNLTLDVTL